MSAPRLNPHLLKIPLYVAGKSAEEVREELGLEEVTKLASNESPIGPSPLAIEAGRAMLKEAHRYPGVSERDLRRKLAAYLNPAPFLKTQHAVETPHPSGSAKDRAASLPVEGPAVILSKGPTLDECNFLVGNGATDLLRMITQAFVFDGGNTVMSRVTFPMYHILTTTFGGTPKFVEPLPGYRHNLEEMERYIDEDTRIVYLCSPNNPSADIITQEEADAFLSKVPEHVVVVFDESYVEFVTDPAYANTLGYVLEGRNVFTVRSFSKTAGLANLRVGFAVGPIALADYVRRTQVPFQSGAIPLVAAAASLDDHEYIKHNAQAVIEGRQYLYSTLQTMNLHCLPSQANFITILDPPQGAAALVEALLVQGIVVRPMGAFGIPNAIRVSVGSMEENKKFIQALKNIFVREAG